MLKRQFSNQLRWKPTQNWSPKLYQDLSKAKLSALVVLTTMCGYAVAPASTQISHLLWTTLGTSLCVSSANSINQWIESPYDAQMNRTRNRVLVRRAMSPLHAFGFGLVTGVAGTSILYMVNPLTALLGASNIVLYTMVYTPLKRRSILNTWIGALVGAIPPIMGYVAATNSIDLGCLVVGGILYSWQFPHFNALAWTLRPDYSKAGYRMMAVTDPALNARVSLRHSLLLIPLCWMAPWLDMSSWYFLVDSTSVNGFMAFYAFKFYKDSNDRNARQLFFSSLIHLPVILGLLMFHKKRRLEEEEEEEKGI